MYMLSLSQSAGMGFDEKESLEAITANLVSFLQMKSQRLYRHSLQVANYSVSVAAKLGLPVPDFAPHDSRGRIIITVCDNGLSL